MNKNKKLVIKVCGEIGTGKTTVAQLINNLFFDYYGVKKVSFKDPDGELFTQQQLEDNMNSLKNKNLEIEIETIQTRRS